MTTRYFSPLFRLMLCHQHLRYGVDGFNQMVRMTAMHEYSECWVKDYSRLKTEPFNIEFARACAGLGQNYSTRKAAFE
jgi:hypothetical protein